MGEGIKIIYWEILFIQIIQIPIQSITLITKDHYVLTNIASEWKEILISTTIKSGKIK